MEIDGGKKWEVKKETEKMQGKFKQQGLQVKISKNVSANLDISPFPVTCTVIRQEGVIKQ